MNKRTVIIGASDNPERYAYKAALSLSKHGHTNFPVGLRKGNIEGQIIYTEKSHFPAIDTVTLYVGPANQAAWQDYILSLDPKRIIFNPGTEGGELKQLAEAKGIECVEACTLVLLSTNQY
jgi:hypothetical protein